MGYSDEKPLAYSIAKDIIEQEKIIATYDNEDMFMYTEGYFRQYGETRIKEIVQLILKERTNTRIVEEVIKHVKRESYFERNELGCPYKNLLNLNNGIFDLETSELKPHIWNYMFINKIPINYNPKAKCPKIDKFFKQIFPKDKLKLAYEIFAYCLYRDIPIQKAFMLLGEGRNGKSTYIKLLRVFLGEENCSSVELQDLEEGRFALARLYGKHVNLFADISSKALKGTSRFKSLTGGDLLDAEKKFKDSFSFQSYAKLIFSANQLPRSPDDSDAFYRRWILIDFPNHFEGKKDDQNLIKKITKREELEGLLQKTVKILQKLLKKRRFSVDPNINEMRELYIRLSDPVNSFIMDCLEKDGETFIIKRVLYKKFVEYCKKGRYPVPSETSFSRALIKEGYVNDYYATILDERHKCWKGYRYGFDDSINYKY